MVFLVDFVARGLGEGLAAGAGYWVLFGVGAWRGRCWPASLPIGSASAWALRLAFVGAGRCRGLAALPVGRARARPLEPGRSAPACRASCRWCWGGCTSWSPPGAGRGAPGAWPPPPSRVGQAAAAYGFSFLFARSGDYGLLFALGAGAIALALLIDLAFARRRT